MQFWSRTFTGTNGDPWPGFSRVAGPAFNATIVTNQGGAGLTAAGPRFYKVSAYPASDNYKVKVKSTHKAAGTAGRSFGIAVRLTSDGKTAYWAHIFDYDPTGPTLGKATLRWYRRRNSTDTQMGSDVDISASVSASQLIAGATFQLRVSNDTENDQVNLKLLIDTGSGLTEAASYDDSAAPIWSRGTGGLVIDTLSYNDDVLMDDFVGQDFEDEATSGSVGDWDDGLGLVINGTYYNAAEIDARGVVSVEARQGYTTGSSIQIRDNRQFHSPTFGGGEDIMVAWNGAIYAYGVIRNRGHYGSPPEGSEYTLRSPKELARGVPIRDPNTNNATVYFNLAPENEYYQEDLDNMTLGDILEWLFDNHLDGEDGLRAHKAAPPDGTAYAIPAALYSIGSELGSITVSGDFVQAVEQILYYARPYGWVIDPESRVSSFVDRSASTAVDIDAQAKHINATIRKNPSVNKTAVIIHGGKPEIEYETVSLSGGGISPGWDTTLGGLTDSEWVEKLKDKGQDASTVNSSGIEFYQGANRLYIVPDTTGDFSMVAGEWRGTSVNFRSPSPATGYAYRVFDNTTSRIYFYTDSWHASPPNVSDAFLIAGGSGLSDDPDERDNAFNERWRMWDIPGVDIAKGECVEARFTTPLPNGGTAVYKMSGEFGGGQASKGGTAKVRLGEPALLPIGLINRFPAENVDLSACLALGSPAGPDGTIADLEIDIPKLTTSVPYLRVPATGFRGTAYSHDPTKWNGGGEATPGIDDGVTDVLAIHDPSYQYPSVQSADYTAFADMVLDALGTLSVEAEITIEDVLDDRFLGLDKKITLSDTGKRTTGYETATDLWVMEVRWNFATHRTTVLCGTQGSFRGLDLEALRKVYTDNARIKNFREQLEAFKKMKECLNEMMGFATQAVQPKGTSNQCTTQISSNTFNSTRNVSSSLDVDIDLTVEFIFSFMDWFLGVQKGITLDDWNAGDTGVGAWSADGSYYWFDFDTGTWTEGGPGGPPSTFGPLPGGADPSNPDGAGMGGWYGELWDAIQFLAGNAGKTIPLNLSDFGLGNPTPGGVVPVGGATYFGPTDGVPIPLPIGGEIPPSGGTQTYGIKGLLGLIPVDLNDIGGPVYQSTAPGASNGLLYRPEMNGPGDYQAGATFTQVELNLGAGRNGGNYIIPPDPVPFPTVADQAASAGPPTLVGIEADRPPGPEVGTIYEATDSGKTYIYKA